MRHCSRSQGRSTATPGPCPAEAYLLMLGCWKGSVFTSLQSSKEGLDYWGKACERKWGGERGEAGRVVSYSPHLR